MNTTCDRKVAADLMQRDIVTVTADDSLRDALKLMIENHVTGLPVMDRNSRCIGLVTATDILNYQDEQTNDDRDGTTQFFDPERQQWEDVPLLAFAAENFADVHVADVMTRDLIWVKRDAPLKEVARQMVDDQIHRVLVMDMKSHLYGIISAFDFVRYAADA